jgi:hypothetical protein
MDECVSPSHRNQGGDPDIFDSTPVVFSVVVQGCCTDRLDVRQLKQEAGNPALSADVVVFKEQHGLLANTGKCVLCQWLLAQRARVRQVHRYHTSGTCGQSKNHRSPLTAFNPY